MAAKRRSKKSTAKKSTAKKTAAKKKKTKAARVAVRRLTAALKSHKPGSKEGKRILARRLHKLGEKFTQECGRGAGGA
jgi:hypothetical protein